ncbi:MAG: site-specific DNA-methyltransferase [Gammaproteobacteria bacterium]|nr:site-specific DNA-methyltransferase [Gammaproteobacteria bacterium]
MTTLKMHTPNLVDSNIERLAELFPNCVTEKPKTDEQGKVIRDMNGEVVLERGIDFELLKQELSHSVIDGSQERYRLDWVGKREAIVTANSPIAKTLRPCREESVDFETTGNLFIEGDNLEALKLLQESYLGKVKTIYIDPPYNTGNDFIYNDDFAADTAEFFERSGQVDADGNRLVANTESNGRFHSDWLSMMYSRLKLARNLLADDGVIFISIDDNEIHNLRKICEDVFGYTNFIAELIVNSNSSKNNAKKISVSHEYILCFVKDFTKETKDWKIQKQQIKAYESRAKQLLKMNLTEDEIHQELLQLVKYPRFYDFDHFTYADKNGVYETDNSGGVDNGNFKTEILHPVTGKPCAKPNGGWRYKDETLKQMVKNNQIVFGKDESIIPRVKRYLHDYNEQVPKSNLYFDSQATTKWLKSEQLPFDFPKSIDLIKHILSFNDEKNALTLDFFAGSSTTAHAVMQLNAEDGGNRKFIMVQIPEATDSKSEAFKAGYPTIAEISKERIRRAGAKIKTDNADKDGINELDTGFRVLKIDTSNMNDIYYRPQDYNQDLLATLENNIKEDRSDEDLLFQFMLDTGVPLSLPIERTELSSKSGGHTIYQVGGNSLIASLDYIDANMVNDIAALNPLKFITSERAIATDSDKTNIKERFKQLSPHTDVRFI